MAWTCHTSGRLSSPSQLCMLHAASCARAEATAAGAHTGPCTPPQDVLAAWAPREPLRRVATRCLESAWSSTGFGPRGSCRDPASPPAAATSTATSTAPSPAPSPSERPCRGAGAPLPTGLASPLAWHHGPHLTLPFSHQQSTCLCLRWRVFLFQFREILTGGTSSRKPLLTPGQARASSGHLRPKACLGSAPQVKVTCLVPLFQAFLQWIVAESHLRARLWPTRVREWGEGPRHCPLLTRGHRGRTGNPNPGC